MWYRREESHRHIPCRPRPEGEEQYETMLVQRVAQIKDLDTTLSSYVAQLRQFILRSGDSMIKAMTEAPMRKPLFKNDLRSLMPVESFARIGLSRTAAEASTLQREVLNLTLRAFKHISQPIAEAGEKLHRTEERTKAQKQELLRDLHASTKKSREMETSLRHQMLQLKQLVIRKEEILFQSDCAINTEKKKVLDAEEEAYYLKQRLDRSKGMLRSLSSCFAQAISQKRGGKVSEMARTTGSGGFLASKSRQSHAKEQAQQMFEDALETLQIVFEKKEREVFATSRDQRKMRARTLTRSSSKEVDTSPAEQIVAISDMLLTAQEELLEKKQQLEELSEKSEKWKREFEEKLALKENEVAQLTAQCDRQMTSCSEKETFEVESERLGDELSAATIERDKYKAMAEEYKEALAADFELRDQYREQAAMMWHEVAHNRHIALNCERRAQTSFDEVAAAHKLRAKKEREARVIAENFEAHQKTASKVLQALERRSERAGTMREDFRSQLSSLKVDHMQLLDKVAKMEIALAESERERQRMTIELERQTETLPSQTRFDLCISQCSEHIMSLQHHCLQRDLDDEVAIIRQGQLTKN
eukprot:GEMP01031283.1.p1 GENE.GEMP01031283.1~~GEMP01031283.1.p1  ORF type:complete len:591 (+),score=136.89 GEMP01031283.1:91-1863(+)